MAQATVKDTTGYVNYVYNISARGTTEVASQLLGLSGMAYLLNVFYWIIQNETTADTRTRLSNKTTKELVDYLIGVDKSIKAGFENAIYFQEWSVGSDILRKRGYGILGPSDLYNL